MVIKSQGFKVHLRKQASDQISELPEHQQVILRKLVEELTEDPEVKGRAIRGERNERVISRGGYRAVYEVKRKAGEIDVLAVTAPLASVVGEGLSVWELPRFKALLEEPVGTPINLTREEAVAIVREAFASMPDLPPGDEYVRQVRPMWAGLLKRRNG